MSSSNRSPLLLDVGGTFVKCEDGRQVPIHSDGTVQEISAALRAAVGPAPADGVGVAIPGPFDYREGIFRMTHKFAAVNGMPFRELAGIPDEVPLRMMHDVNAALLGAHVLSGQQGNAALVTMGTGLGFAYSIDGRPQCNDAGSPARSLYNLPYADGILEDAVSARGIRNAYRDRTRQDIGSAHLIAQRAYAGDVDAQEVFSDLGRTLGEFLPPLLEKLGTETLWFGGQISKSFSLLERPLRNALADALPGLSVSPLPAGAVFAGLKTLFI